MLGAAGSGDDLVVTDDVANTSLLDEGTTPDDASTGDGAVASDAAVSGDGHVPCSPATCTGCCDSAGVCHGGASASTCGTGAQQCVACSSGKVCSNGTCAASGGPPPSCTTNSCRNGCIPVWQGSCCKSDGTCGCQVLIPPGSCQ
ncbi:MAG: hypothetical protein ACRENE_24075 [Polyangiaceae bacterium]